MKHSIFILFLLLFYCDIYSQDSILIQPCHCNAILIPKHEKIPLYNLPNGRIINSIINDTITEDYVTFVIYQIIDDYSRVEGSGTLIVTVEKFGWIEKKYLGVYPVPNTEEIIKLYSKPDTNSKVKSVIMKPYFFPANIISCKNKWLYVKYLDYDNEIKEGWLPFINQCSNPYSPCN